MARVRKIIENCSAYTRIALSVVLTLLGLLLSTLPNDAQTGRTALVFHIRGIIGPAAVDYLSRGLHMAAERNAPLVIIEMDTPGGLDTSMRDIIRDILASPVPVATYVAPSGARAASAGTYILYASHIAAMAPGTNLGAATPVQIGGGGMPFPGDNEQPKDQDQTSEKKPDGDTAQPQKPGNAMEAKAINDAVAYIRSLAELRGRNIDWAEKAVREAASLPASTALKENVIDIVTPNLDDLLVQANGRTVTAAGNQITLNTSGITLEHVEPDWRTEFLTVITNPNVALILMMIGIYGLIFEFMNPGALFPGTIGAICLLIGLYALAVLPVNLAGLGLILLGLALMAAEAFTPSFGVLGVGGALAFIFGATILVDTDVPGFRLSWPVVGAVALASLALSLLIVRMAIASHKRPVATGAEQMIGAYGEILDWRGNAGHVLAHGERWSAVSGTPLKKGQKVHVAGIQGLVLKVEPYTPENS
ncbi:nodulation protein NfeD [Paramesorhizobium deserti]|uniref:Nodulation protein NfeD n=1 Tax=Paramesorhizobium deserti TaxID=1494590 RepID=A0A135HSJ4_9HYPH|nr:nodulation protein NfeD [Paramesorhizobium deserti]KXF76167.1 nodulation protein NfeD [Paramesorhizobium deserti]